MRYDRLNVAKPQNSEHRRDDPLGQPAIGREIDERRFQPRSPLRVTRHLSAVIPALPALTPQDGAPGHS